MSETVIATEETEVIATEGIEVVKPYELRKLCAKDIFPMSKILAKIGIKEITKNFDLDNINEFAEKLIQEKGDMEAMSDADIVAVGIPIALDVADVIFDNLSACEEYIYQLLSNLSGIPKKEISELPIDVFASMIIDVVKKEEFADFIKAVSKLLK